MYKPGQLVRQDRLKFNKSVSSMEIQETLLICLGNICSKVQNIGHQQDAAVNKFPLCEGESEEALVYPVWQSCFVLRTQMTAA